MNYDREIKIDKLKNNISRQKYLKILAVACLCLDLTTYILHETIELAFIKLPQEMSILLGYIFKVNADFYF